MDDKRHALAARTGVSVRNTDSRAFLASYKEQTTLRCLECGHYGMMGVDRKRSAWWTIPAFLAVFITWILGLPSLTTILAGVVLALVTANAGRTWVTCPFCRRQLTLRGKV